MKNLYIIIRGSSEISKLNEKVTNILHAILKKINSTGIIGINNSTIDNNILNIALSTYKEKKELEYIPTALPNVILGGLEIIYGELAQKILKIQTALKKDFEEYFISSPGIEEFKEKSALFSNKIVDIFTQYSDISQINKKLGKDDVILYIGECPNEFRKEIEKINEISEENYYCISEETESKTIDNLISKLDEA